MNGGYVENFTCGSLCTHDNRIIKNERRINDLRNELLKLTKGDPTFHRNVWAESKPEEREVAIDIPRTVPCYVLDSRLSECCQHNELRDKVNSVAVFKSPCKLIVPKEGTQLHSVWQGSTRCSAEKWVNEHIAKEYKDQYTVECEKNATSGPGAKADSSPSDMRHEEGTTDAGGPGAKADSSPSDMRHEEGTTDAGGAGDEQETRKDATWAEWIGESLWGGGDASAPESFQPTSRAEQRSFNVYESYSGTELSTLDVMRATRRAEVGSVWQ